MFLTMECDPCPLSTPDFGNHQRTAEGAPIGAKALLHLGKRAAVDQALWRLAHRRASPHRLAGTIALGLACEAGWTCHASAVRSLLPIFAIKQYREDLIVLECPQRYKHTSTIIGAQSEAEVPEGNNAAHRVYWQAALCIKPGLKYPQHLPVSKRGYQHSRPEARAKRGRREAATRI